jgi:hypothetical protein
VISRDQLIEEMGKAYYRLHDPRRRITPLVRMRAALDAYDELMRPQKEAFTKLLEAAKVARDNTWSINPMATENLDAAISAAEEALK